MSETRTIVRGAGWVSAQRWLERGLSLATLVLLARLLTPEDFGLVAIATGLALLVEGLTEFEVRAALIQAPEQNRALHDTAWTLAGLRGLVIASVLLAVAAWLDDPRLAQTVAALALCPLLDGLANPRFALLERESRFAPLALQSTAAASVSAVVAIALGLLWRSHWALVAGYLVASALRSALSFGLCPYRPRPCLAAWRPILRFSGWMSLATLVSAISLRSDRLIVGALLGLDRTGVYFMAQRMATLATDELLAPLARVLFPSFRRLAADPERLRRAVAESIGAGASLVVPAGCALALVAGDLVPLVLGGGWLAVVPLLLVLGPFRALRASLQLTRPLVMALGRTRLQFFASAAFASVHVPLFVFGTWRYGLAGAVAAIVASGGVYLAASLWLLRETVGLGGRAVLFELHRPLLAALVATGVLLGLEAAGLELWVEGGSPAALATKLGLGLPVHLAAQWGLWRLEGRPAGFERRALATLARRRGRPDGNTPDVDRDPPRLV